METENINKSEKYFLLSYDSGQGQSLLKTYKYPFVKWGRIREIFNREGVHEWYFEKC